MVRFYVGKGAIAPTRNKGDAGFDFYIPTDWAPYNDEQSGKFIHPGEGVLINTKIRSDLPEGIALIAFNKSGVSTKKHLQVGACVVDASYQGEIHIHVYNWGTEDIYVNRGDKLVQFVPIKINDNHSEAVYHDDMSVDKFYNQTSERGEGGFGSTGDRAKEVIDEVIYNQKRNS